MVEYLTQSPLIELFSEQWRDQPFAVLNRFHRLCMSLVRIAAYLILLRSGATVVKGLRRVAPSLLGWRVGLHVHLFCCVVSELDRL